MLAPDLNDLTEYFAPLSTLQREESGALTLLTPGVNVLGLNATYLPAGEVDLRPALAWHEAQGQPPLLAAAQLPAGVSEVDAVLVGTWQDRKTDSQEGAPVVVEQISRLHLGAWAGVLCAAHGTPGWAAALARHLAGRLEHDRTYTLLTAYRDGQAVGALLWQARGTGGAAHLWGALDGEAARPLLNTAAKLGTALRVSVPRSWAADLGESVTANGWVGYGLDSAEPR
ncbi:hypothetical protein [Deinococcus aerophilus]|uniref:GNAT family N-acetyltransferase n=1 Tax=Deinococcus aerophilus TaxID=522488 RepID=A0ABQ2H040_9DEIO|nr:hypothetical protein [Deinococcus aerophilus]GGM20574.1 hypothetical protein GCM10010841_30690 [Deinococcus aerophilus]